MITVAADLRGTQSTNCPINVAIPVPTGQTGAIETRHHSHHASLFYGKSRAWWHRDVFCAYAHTTTKFAAAAVQTPQEVTCAREALARAPAQSPSDAAALAVREREVDAALRTATTTSAFRHAQARQLTVRKIFLSRFDALVRGARVSDAFARLSLYRSDGRGVQARAGRECGEVRAATQRPRASGPTTRRNCLPPSSRRWSPSARSATSSSAP